MIWGGCAYSRLSFDAKHDAVDARPTRGDGWLRAGMQRRAARLGDSSGMRLTSVVTVGAVALEQAPAVLCERHNALTRIHGDEPDEHFFPKVAQVFIARCATCRLGTTRRHRPSLASGRRCD